MLALHRLFAICLPLVASVLLAAEPAVKSGQKLPPITRPLMFDTPEADAVLAAMQVFPPANPWNTDVSKWPVHKDSAAIVASIGVEKPLRYNTDMAFVLVPPGQPEIDVRIVEYPDESDKGPYPV